MAVEEKPGEACMALREREKERERERVVEGILG